MAASKRRRFVRSALVSVVVAGMSLALPAHAKRVFVDFGEDNLETSGNGWDPNDSHELDRTGDGACDGSPCTAIGLGFAINFGLGTFDSLFIHENGAVSFGNPLTQGSFTPVANLSGLGAPVIAPFYADFTTTAPDGDVFSVNAGEMLFSRGIADPDEDQNGVYSLASAVPAFHVTWAGPTVGSDPTQVFTDIVIYSRGSNGDFDIRFGYGDESTPITPGLGSIAGFSLGPNNHQFTGPYASSDDFYFPFRDGVWTETTPPPPISEPSTITLCLLGLAGIIAARRRFAKQER